MKTTIKQQILRYLQFQERWCSGSELEDQAHNWQTKASTIARRARELVNEGKIESKLGILRTTQYKYLIYPPLQPQTVPVELIEGGPPVKLIEVDPPRRKQEMFG